MGAMPSMKTETEHGVVAKPVASVSHSGVTMSSMPGLDMSGGSKPSTAIRAHWREGAGTMSTMPGMAVAIAMGDGSGHGAHDGETRTADSRGKAPGSMADMTMSGPTDARMGGMGRSMARGAMGHGGHGGMKMGGMAGMGMGGEDFLSASYPVQGQTVSGGPAALRLVFTRPVQLRSLQLFASSGARVPLDIPGGTAAASFSTPLPRLPPDTYQARWRIASPDGGADNGAIDFKVG